MESCFKLRRSFQRRLNHLSSVAGDGTPSADNWLDFIHRRLILPKWGIHRAILVSLAIMGGASTILLALEQVGQLTVAIIVAIEFAYWFGAGFLAPNTAAGVMMSHPKAIGAAAAALGFCQMCFAGTVAFVQGLIYDGTALPMLGVQVVLSVIALVTWRYLPRCRSSV